MMGAAFEVRSRNTVSDGFSAGAPIVLGRSM